MVLPGWLSRDLTELAVGLLEDQRVKTWVDQRITNALTAQRDQLFGKIETSGATVINETGAAIKATQGVLQGNINGLSQALSGATNSIVNNIVSQIKGIINPFHLGRCPQCGYKAEGE